MHRVLLVKALWFRFVVFQKRLVDRWLRDLLQIDLVAFGLRLGGRSSRFVQGALVERRALIVPGVVCVTQVVFGIFREAKFSPRLVAVILEFPVLMTYVVLNALDISIFSFLGLRLLELSSALCLVIFQTTCSIRISLLL